MPGIVVVRTQSGLKGLGDKSERAFDRFKSKVNAMHIGETLRFSWIEPRSSKLHRLHFALLNSVFDAQEQFQDFESFRMWVQVGSGLCIVLPGPMGKPVAIPKSIAWEKLDDVAFADHHEATKRFLRTQHATRFLWPLMSDMAADAAMNALLEEFEQ